MKSIQPVTMQDHRHQTDFLAQPLFVAGTGFHGEAFIREQHFQQQAPDLVNISELSFHHFRKVFLWICTLIGRQM